MSKLVSTIVGLHRRARKMATTSAFIPREKFLWILAPLALALKLVNKLSLGLGVSEFVHGPFKSRVLVSYSLLALLELSSTDTQRSWS